MAIDLELERQLKELEELLAAVRDSVTPGMVERLGKVVEALGEIAGQVEDTATRTAVLQLLRMLPELTAALKPAVDLLGGLEDSVTPEMASRAAALLADLGLVARRAAEPANRAALEALIDRLPDVQATLLPLLSWLKATQDSVTPGMVERAMQLVTSLGEIADRVAEPRAKAAAQELIAALPDVQATLLPLLSLLRGLNDAVSPGMIERTAGLLAGLGEIAQRLNEPPVRDAALRLIEVLPAVSDTLLPVLRLLETASAAITPGMVERMGSLVGSLSGVLTRIQEPRIQEALLEALDQLPDLVRLMKPAVALGQAALDGVVPGMVERLASMAAGLGELGSWINEPNTRAALLQGIQVLNGALPVLQQMAAWQADGTWEAVSRLLAGDTLRRLDHLMQAMEAAVADAESDRAPLGLMALNRRLKDPEVARGVKWSLALLRRAPGAVGTPAPQ
ncbi:MAG: hypothetical protein OWV35_09750 [Firmicutes bacterium]|nr:hypothetical protein [Bacillota bacterium]